MGTASVQHIGGEGQIVGGREGEEGGEGDLLSLLALLVGNVHLVLQSVPNMDSASVLLTGLVVKNVGGRGVVAVAVVEE